MTAATATRQFQTGDKVTVNHPRCAGKVYEITLVKRTKAFIRLADDPTDRGLDAPMNMLAFYDENAPMPTPTAHVRTRPIITLKPGQVVTLTRPFRNVTTQTLMVITKVNATTVSLDPLGGTGAIAMRASAESVKVVPMEDLAVRLAG